jgi:hypothetical protein
MGSNEFHSEYNPNITQLQNQFASTGISFMTRDPLVEKDPAVLAIATDPNSYPYNTYRLSQTGDQIINNNPIADPNNPSIQQKATNYEKSQIPTQTYTNQQFASALIPTTTATAHVFPTVPVSMPAVPMTALIQTDMIPTMTSDMNFAANQHQFMNANHNDKHLNTSHDRHQNFNTTDDNFKNNRVRGNRSENPKKNVNGSGNRGRNANKGGGYGGQMGTFGTFSNKYENQMNGSNYGSNTFGGEKSSNNNFGGSGGRGRPQQSRGMGRPERGPDNRRTNNYNVNSNPNFGATAAK